MKNMFVDYAKHTIQMSKAFAEKAGTVNTPEYEELYKARMMNPDYRIVVVKNPAPKSKDEATKVSYKGLDYDFMEKFIMSLDDKAQKEILLEDFKTLKAEKVNYIEIRTWFVETFEVFKNCKCKADVILALRKSQVAQMAMAENTKANDAKAEDTAA